ncbi:MAG: hypothetical protein JWR26_1990 [Pedosphaera sp.]|nr:hypothetical protein [Pedosphaera sp.]
MCFPTLCSATFALLAASVTPSYAATVWDGPILSFSELSTANGSQPADQDRITPGVWLTRGTTRGLFNASQESSYTSYSSPAGTEWAFGSLANYASLTYSDWQTWTGSNPPGSASNPPGTVGQPAVLHLTAEDIYMSITFTSWGVRSGGFSYERSTMSVVPEPSSTLLIAMGAVVLGGVQWRRRRGNVTSARSR